MGKAQKPVRRKDTEANNWYSYISFRKKKKKKVAFKEKVLLAVKI